jgi:GntR family transcriptional regulator/MocR family aminotransferase
MRRSSLFLLQLDRRSATPLYKQVYNQLRQDILAGRLKPGCRLPSARLLAAEWSISRITAETAYNHLLAEGYVQRRVGSGTHVANDIPDVSLHVGAGQYRRKETASLSNRGRTLSAQTLAAPGYHLATPFQSGLPDLGTLPLLWKRIMGRHLTRMKRSMAGYGDPAGLMELRSAIAEHVVSHRGVHCAPEQIVITAGAQQGIDLCARLLLDRGDEAWVEDPCYAPGVATLRSAGAKVIPVPIDAEGLMVSAGSARSPSAKLAYVTPSRQYPLGVSMSMQRRKQLLEWVSGQGSWIIEDDYDSEFRYHGQPLEALQGLDRSSRVIYVGTFSKVLFPSLRIGYLVLPPNLVDYFVAAKSLADRHGPSLEQAALAEFISEGHFATHLRRMRRIYAQRQKQLQEIAKIYWRNSLAIEPSFGGLFMVGRLTGEGCDIQLSARAFERNIRVRPLSPLYLEQQAQPGFLLGYAAFTEGEMVEAARVLANLLEP